MYDTISITDKNDAGSSNKSQTSVAFDQIRTDILRGVLKPDERLRINTLAERYEVGPTVIREALSRLVSNGLVNSEDQRGFSVAPVSREELLDLTQARIDIESLALTKAIENGDIDWESGVISAMHRLSKFQTPPTTYDAQWVDNWSRAHLQFHASLLAGCKSPWLMNIAGLLYERSERYRNLSIQQSDPSKHNLLAEKRSKDVLSEHRALMEAAIGRDAAKARQLLSDHFWDTTKIILSADIDGHKAKAHIKKPAT